ncbi:MAG: flippase-like domain-containing protein [Candidatus Omnitrophica bacterium]|nr:flippase-like domain-containing protein [Candidatus Omnitrophota bacterium]
MKNHPAASFALRLAISFGALGIIVFFLRDKLSETLLIIQTEVAWPWFFLAVVIYGAAIFIQAIRLQLVFKVQKIIMSLKEAAYLHFIGLFFNLFFPSAVGGDVAKAYFAYKHTGKKMESTTSVIFDRLMGFVALILMAITVTLFFSTQLVDTGIIHWVFASLFLMVATMLFFASKRVARHFKFLKVLIPSQKWRDRLSDLYHMIHNYRNHKTVLALCILTSFISQVMFITAHYWLALSLGVDISIWLFFILIPLLAVVSMAPSVGGLGVREAGVVYFFSKHMASERAFALSLLLDLLLYGYSFAAGLIFALRGGLKKKLIHEMEALQ